MKLDKQTVRRIMWLIVFTVVFTAFIQNIGVVWAALGAVVRVFSPVLLGLSIAFVLNVPVRAIEQRLFAPLNRRLGDRWSKLRRPLSLLLSILLVFGLIILLINLILPQLGRAVEVIANALPGWARTVTEWAAPYLEMVGLEADSGEIFADWSRISKFITDFLKNASSVVGTTVNVTSQVVGTVTNVVIGLIFAIYVLISKEKLAQQTRRLLYAVMKPEGAHTVMRLCAMANNAFSGFLSGQFAEGVIIGVMVFLGMRIFAFPNAAMVAAITGAFALVPIFGALIGAVLGALIVLMDSPVMAFWFLVFIIVLQQLESNIIYPRVMSNAVGLPSLWVLAAVTVGGNVGGVLGMLVGVPIVSVLYALVREYVWDKLGARLRAARQTGDAATQQVIEEVLEGETPKKATGKQRKSFIRSVADRMRSSASGGEDDQTKSVDKKEIL